MSPTCRRHVADTGKCRQICPKLHFGSDTTHEKRVPDTADLCVVPATPYKITTSCLHADGRLLHKRNTASTAVTTAATTAVTTATAAVAATGAATATAAGGPPHRPLPYPVLQIQASSDSGPDWSRLCSVGYMATTQP